MECMNSYMKENTAMQHKIKILEDEINNKILDNTSEKKKILELRNKISRFENNENYLKNEITNLNRKLIDMEYEEGNSAKIKELKKLIDEIREERDKYIMEVDQMERKLANINEENEKKIAHNRGELEQNFLKSLQEEKKKYEEKVQAEKEKNENLQKEIDQYKQKSSSLESLIEIKDKMIQDFNHNMDSKVQAKHNKFKAKSDKELKRMTLRIRDLSAEKSKMRKTIQSQEERMAKQSSDFTLEKESLENSNSELVDGNKILMEEIEELNKEITAAKSELMAEKVYKEKTIAQLREDLTLNENRNICLTEELIDTNKKVKENSQMYEEKIRYLVTQINDLKEQLNSKSHFDEFLNIKKDKLEVEKQNQELKANTIQLQKELSIEKKTCDIIMNTTMAGTKILGTTPTVTSTDVLNGQKGPSTITSNSCIDIKDDSKVVYTSKSKMQDEEDKHGLMQASSSQAIDDDKSAISLGNSVMEYESNYKVGDHEDVDEQEENENLKERTSKETGDCKYDDHKAQSIESSSSSIVNTGKDNAFSTYVKQKRNEKNQKQKGSVLPTTSYVLLDDEDDSTILYRNKTTSSKMNRNSMIKKRLGSRLSFTNNNNKIKEVIDRQYQDVNVNQELERKT